MASRRTRRSVKILGKPMENQQIEAAESEPRLSTIRRREEKKRKRTMRELPQDTADRMLDSRCAEEQNGPNGPKTATHSWVVGVLLLASRGQWSAEPSNLGHISTCGTG